MCWRARPRRTRYSRSFVKSPALVDLRIQQPFDYPTFQVARRPHQGSSGRLYRARCGHSMLNTLSGSFQVTPMFFLNWKNMVNYSMVAQTPQYKMDTMQDLENIPINHSSTVLRVPASAAPNPEILNDLATVRRGNRDGSR